MVKISNIFGTAIITAIFLIDKIKSQIAKGECTPNKCISCFSDGMNKWCNQCVNSQLKISENLIDGRCEGNDSGIPNCAVSLDLKNGTLACKFCQEGYSVNLTAIGRDNNNQCVKLPNNCISGYYEEYNDAMQCTSCENGFKKVIIEKEIEKDGYKRTIYVGVCRPGEFLKNCKQVGDDGSCQYCNRGFIQFPTFEFQNQYYFRFKQKKSECIQSNFEKAKGMQPSFNTTCLELSMYNSVEVFGSSSGNIQNCIACNFYNGYYAVNGYYDQSGVSTICQLTPESQDTNEELLSHQKRRRLHLRRGRSRKDCDGDCLEMTK